MLPAVQVAFNRNREDDNLDKVFGYKPRHRIIAISLMGILLGEFVTWVLPDIIVDIYFINRYVNWSAVLIAVAFALLFRRYLFQSGFSWLAASLVPAAACIAVIAFIKQLNPGSLELIEDAPIWVGVSAILLAGVNALGVVAALTIAFAALCFSRDWLKALGDLAVQLLVFKIMVWVTILVIVEIGIVGPILAGIIEGVFGITFPDWLSEFVDQLTLVGLLTVLYGAVIGATWSVCKQSFGALLETGEVRILKALNKLTKKPNKPKKTKESKESKTP